MPGALYEVAWSARPRPGLSRCRATKRYYGIAAEQSIGQLFAAGIVPGIVIAVLFCVWVYIAQRMEDRKPRKDLGWGDMEHKVPERRTY